MAPQDEDGRLSVPMIHYACDVCSMTATMVVTPASSLAWLDHMSNHHDPKYFQCWTWQAVKLPFEDVY